MKIILINVCDIDSKETIFDLSYVFLCLSMFSILGYPFEDTDIIFLVYI